MHKKIIIPLICQCGLFMQHVCLKIQLCIKMWFFTSFDSTWYAAAAIYTKKLLFSHPIVSYWSLVNNTGEVLEWNWQSVTKVNGVKNAIMKLHTFWMALCLICHLFVILFYIERKCLLMGKLIIILPLKSKLSRKFQGFNAIDRSIKMLKNSWIFKNTN